MKARYFSLRKHLVIGIVGATLAILGGVAGATYWALKHESDEIFKARLATSARVLEALIADQLANRSNQGPFTIALPQGLEQTQRRMPDDADDNYERKIAFQVWNDAGLLLARSESAPDKPLGPFVEGSSNQKLSDGYWEVFALKSGPMWVLAAEHNEVLEETTNQLALAILTPFLVGTLILLMVVNWLLLYNLRPLNVLAQKIAAREPDALTPIVFDVTPLELKPVIDALNALLERVNKAFEREQWFIDAAAHELRTPIAALQIHVQNALLASNDVDRQASLKEALEGLRRTTRLAEQLLTFSRVASATDVEANGFLMLDVVCKALIENCAEVLRQKGQTAVLEVQGECVIKAPLGKIERLIQNLLDNAFKYGDAQSQIVVTLVASPDQVVLTVANRGPMIPMAEKAKIFEPYYRVLGSKVSGTGLGLAIVQQIVKQSGGRIEVEDTNPQGTQFTVIFPQA